MLYVKWWTLIQFTSVYGLCSTDFSWHVMCDGPLQWCHNGRDGVSNHQPHSCLLNRLFRRRSKKTSKLRVTGLCAGNSPVTGEFPAQMASNAENVSIWWRHHAHVNVTLCCHMMYVTLVDFTAERIRLIRPQSRLKNSQRKAFVYIVWDMINYLNKLRVVWHLCLHKITTASRTPYRKYKDYVYRKMLVQEYLKK